MSTFRRSRPQSEPPKIDPLSSATPTSHERIPIFMIQEKDASTPCDERHDVKNISNVNLSTQKKTGGKCIMGNQGMTNWKFSAFFAIALMLMAGLFTGTAMAGDGDGTIEVVNAPTDNLDAGSVDNTLTFTYEVPADMADGHFRLEIPQRDSWAVSKKSITITDGRDPIYVTDADGAVDEDATDTTADTRARVEILPKSAGANVRTVTVKLATAGNLVLTFTVVTAAVPSSLDMGTGSDSYRRYKFIASSAEKDGRMTELKAIDEDNAHWMSYRDDEADDARAYVNVGNVAGWCGNGYD